MGRHRCAAKANDGSSRTPRQFLARAVRIPHRSGEVGVSEMPRRLINQRWTPEEDELIVKLAREAKTSNFIARQLRRTSSAVRVRKQKLPGIKLKVKAERQP